MKSLQSQIAPLSEILGLKHHTLYERQLALVRAKLLPKPPGRGPGSGTVFSPSTVATLLISMMASDNIVDCVETTRALSASKLIGGPIWYDGELSKAKNFKDALICALSNDTALDQIEFFRIYRRRFRVEIFIVSLKKRDAHDENDHLLFQGQKGFAGTFDGMATLVEMGGGIATGRDDGKPTLAKIRDLLRGDEYSETSKIPAAKSKSKGLRK